MPPWPPGTLARAGGERCGAGMWVRISAAVAVSVVVLVAAVIVAYRVFAPHETLTAPTVPYPPVAIITDDRPFSELRAAPLVVEGRLRVYAEKWRVWADAPVGERYESTPYWAYRRWPAAGRRGRAGVQTVAGPMVITQWSDGELIALDARRGEIAWRATAPLGPLEYDGRRTGASVVYEPQLAADRPGGRPDRRRRRGPQTCYRVRRGHRQAVCGSASMARGCEPCRGPAPGWSWCPTVTARPSRSLLRRRRHREGALDLTREGLRAGAVAVRDEPVRVPAGDRSAVRTLAARRRTGTSTAVPPLEPGALLAGDRVVYPTITGVAARPLGDRAIHCGPGRARASSSRPTRSGSTCSPTTARCSG